MSNILKQYTKFIFPFQYEKEKIDVALAQIEGNKANKLNVFEPFTISTESLRDGLELLLDENGGKSKIADCYQLNVNCRKYFSLPSKRTEPLTFLTRQNNDENFEVLLTDIRLYLFESLIGFVEVECEYAHDTVDAYLDLNYFICETKSEKNKFVYHQKIWDPETRTSSFVDVEFSMKDLLDKILVSISKESDSIKFSYQKVKPIIYSHLLLSKAPDNTDELLHHLAKNYKQSYKFDSSCAKIETYHPFENSYWTASLNGAVNVSFLTDDNTTNDFFENNFYWKTRNTYFYLFINALHQRYAVIKIMGKIGGLDRLSNDYYVMEEELKMARKYEAEAISLKFRAFFLLPSTIDHINEYYDMVYDAFQVGQLYYNFNTEVKNLQNICGQYVTRIKERDEKIKKRRNAKIEIFVSIFSALVAEVTLFNDSWELFEKMLGHSLSFWSPAILILLGTLLSPLFVIILNVMKKTQEIKSLTKQIIAEERDCLVEDDKIRKAKGKRISKLRKQKDKK